MITDLASFNSTNGGNPLAGLIMDGAGNLYGTAWKGGANGYGTVFEVVNGSGAITVLASFNGTNGADPLAGLIMDGAGNLYGTTSLGGAYNDGTVFAVANDSGAITALASFNGTNGNDPYGGLVMDGSGNLYGTTYSGGASNYGAVFEVVNDSGAITDLASFNGTNGDYPYAGLIMDGNGNLYGTTNAGGASSDGTVFELNTVPFPPPVVTTSGGSLAYTEGNPATAIDPALTVSDSSINVLAGATVTISGNYASGQDVLGFTSQNGITGSWNAATGVLTLSGSSSVANYQTALESVTYRNTSANPSTLTRTISFTATDGATPSAAATRTIQVTAVDNAPVVTTSTGTLSYMMGNAAAVDSAVTVSDVDSPNMASAVVRFTSGYQSGQDVLSFVNTATITGTWDATQGSLTLTGTDTVANYQAALRAVKYQNTSGNPNTSTTRTVGFTVNDGQLDSNTATRNLLVKYVNLAGTFGSPWSPLPSSVVAGKSLSGNVSVVVSNLGIAALPSGQQITIQVIARDTTNTGNPDIVLATLANQSVSALAANGSKTFTVSVSRSAGLPADTYQVLATITPGAAIGGIEHLGQHGDQPGENDCRDSGLREPGRDPLVAVVECPAVLHHCRKGD